MTNAQINFKNRTLMRRQARTELENIARAGVNANPGRAYMPNRGPANGVPRAGMLMRPGQMQTPYGMTPQEGQVDQLLARTGMAPQPTAPQVGAAVAPVASPGALPVAPPLLAPPVAGGGTMGAGDMGGAAGAAGGGALATYQANEQAAAERARQETIARYNEAHGLAADLIPRNQARIDALGRDQNMLNKEAFNEFMSTMRARLGPLGNADSSRLEALGQRQARDTAILDAGINSRRSEQGLDADTRDTGSLIDVIKTRNDIAGASPELQAQVAMQLGQQEAADKQAAADQKHDVLQQALAEKHRRESRRRGFLRGAAPVARGLISPIMAGAGPLQMAAGMAGGLMAPAFAALARPGNDGGGNWGVQTPSLPADFGGGPATDFFTPENVRAPRKKQKQEDAIYKRRIAGFTPAPYGGISEDRALEIARDKERKAAVKAERERKKKSNRPLLVKPGSTPLAVQDILGTYFPNGPFQTR